MEESDRKVTIMNVPENTKTIKVAVNKIDAVTAEPVEGAVFAVYEDEKVYEGDNQITEDRPRRLCAVGGICIHRKTGHLLPERSGCTKMVSRQ